MRERFIAPVLVLLGLAVYYPVLQSGPFILDDGDIIAHIRGLAGVPFTELSLFGNGGTYYRPVLMLSFLVDLAVWDMHPGFMHLFNILLHVGNAMLVYLNVRTFYPQKQDVVRTLPLAAATLFLIHPLNTESVNWIAGRTDPLAAFFVLIAIYLVLLSMQDRKRYRFWLAALCMLLGSMSKEVAFFSFPAVILFLFLYKEKRPSSSNNMSWTWRLTAIVPMLLGGGAYFVLRTASFKHADKGIAVVTEATAYQLPLNAAKQLITDFGFYIKKLFIPYPLSLAIDQVSPHYFWLGLIATILFVILMFLRDYLMGMVLLIALTIFPALLNAFFHIAWTPYAERYLYLAVAFLCIAFAIPQPFEKAIIRKYQKIFLIALICIFLPTTVHRNWLWADPLELTRLTHQQNPANPTAWSMYAVMLANRQNYDEARSEFKKVLQQHPDHLYTIDSLASMEMYIDQPEAAREVLEVFFSKQLTPNNNILRTMLECNQERLRRERDATVLRKIRNELIATYLMRYKTNLQEEDLLHAARLASQNSGDNNDMPFLEKLLENKEISVETFTKASTRLAVLTQKDDLH